MVISECIFGVGKKPLNITENVLNITEILGYYLCLPVRSTEFRPSQKNINKINELPWSIPRKFSIFFNNLRVFGCTELGIVGLDSRF